MSISRSAYESILKEYNDRRISNARATESRRALVYGRVPGLSELEAELNSLRVSRTIGRIKGQAPEDISREEALKAERDAMLKSAGFSLKDLEPIYTCPICKDNGILEDGSQCQCFRQRLSEVLYDNSNIKKLLETENFDTFSFKYYSPETDEAEGRSPLDSAKDAFLKARRFVKDFEGSADNLLITGSTGLGKTFLSNCIAKDIIDKGHSVIYISAVKFFDILADKTFNRSPEDSDARRAAEQLYGCELLIIDDLGTEITNSFVQTQLFDCINERLTSGKHTIISTNLSLEKLKNNYSERIFSRILSKYTLINLIGEDIRMKKKLAV